MRDSKEGGVWQQPQWRGDIEQRDLHTSTLAYINLAGDSMDPVRAY